MADPSKRRNVVLNEKELLVPLEHGWRRQTTIHGMGRRGIVGEVLYFAPCNKKMKTIPDVMRVSCRDVLLGMQCGLWLVTAVVEVTRNEVGGGVWTTSELGEGGGGGGGGGGREEGRGQ